MSSIPQKRCTKCGNTYAATPEKFSRDKSKKDGLHSHCNLCRSEAAHKRFVNNPDKARENNRKWRINNPKRYREGIRKWREKNTEHYRETNRRWYAEHGKEKQEIERRRRYAKEHPEKAREYAQRRKSRKAKLESTLTQSEWEQILADYGYACAYCGRAWHEIDGKLEQEHVIPVTQNGGYTATNIVPACGTCNRKKFNKTPEQAGMKLRDKISHS